ncbi:hypothetical protein Glove_443g32 [Diversispora epigaea]|uniref:Uncharacterized protein n=1 Tax=Diversispora epigaea TaxID=1348612 RepID=A0A397GW79_9GLOM|nr:hypothetical protein Glove_443g32 [Diversispora epigaea]
MRNRSIFAFAIAGLPAFITLSTSNTSRRTRPGTEPHQIDSLDKKIYSFLKEQIDIKKRLKNIELLSEINNDPDFSKDVITRVTTNVFKVNIFPSKKNLKEETESVIRKNFPDIYELMDSQYYLSLFKKIKTKLLEKLCKMRGEIASQIKSAIFEIFGESQLPRIDFQSSLAKINSWKSDQRVKDAYRKLFEVFSDNYIKKRLKNIELLSEINNDPDFSKDVITRVTTNVFKVNIFPSKKNLKEETESVIRKNFPDIYELMDSQYYLSLFKKIKTKLLEKLCKMRGEIASQIKSAIFEIFGESQLPRIDFQSSLAKINSWKSDQRVKDAYRKLFEVFSDNCTYMEIILDRI